MTSALDTTAFVVDDAALDTLFREARTANTFTDEPVSIDQVREIVTLAGLGPTAMNNQPLRVLVVTEESRERLLPLMAEGNREKTASAPVALVLAADPRFHDRLPEHFPPFPGARDMFESQPEQRERDAEFNAALQIGYLTVAIRAAGLAAGPMGGFDREGVDREFFAESGWRSLVVMNVGHPGEDAWQERLPRIAFEDAVEVL